MKRFLSKFFYIIGDEKKRLFSLIFLFIFSSLLDAVGIGLIGPFITLATLPQEIYNHAVLSQVYKLLNFTSEVYFVAFFGLGITLIFYIKSVLSFNIQRYSFKFSFGQKGRLVKKLLYAYLAAPYTFHLSRNTALLIQNILSETNNFCNGIMLPFLNALANAIVIIFLTLLLIKTNITATAFILLILFIPLCLYYKFKDQLTQWGKEASKAQVGMIRTINHSLGGLKETKIIGCESYFEALMDGYVEQFEHVNSASQTFKLLPRIIIEAVLITFLVGFTSILLISSGSTQNLTAVLGIFTVASIRLIPSVTQLTNATASLRNFSYTLTQLYMDLKEVEELTAQQKQVVIQGSNNSAEKFPEFNTHRSLLFNHQISLDRIVYTYPNIDEPALRGVSLSLKKGESIALIGKSGAGKTTLVDVILGLLAPQNGDITVDGVSIYSDLRSWQNLIGYIPQSIFLMDETIESNIAFGVPKHLIDPEKLQKAIALAQLSELIEELPDGIHTVVGERGVRLSGGQRQRIGIARTLYHEREILVLDEATSALDNETEKLVNEAIQSLSGVKTL
ncbi:MAG TPA: ABC transporter ATP-binding protein, partial [Cyanophyceae cyanobacterium]